MSYMYDPKNDLEVIWTALTRLLDIGIHSEMIVNHRQLADHALACFQRVRACLKEPVAIPDPRFPRLEDN